MYDIVKNVVMPAIASVRMFGFGVALIKHRIGRSGLSASESILILKDCAIGFQEQSEPVRAEAPEAQQKVARGERGAKRRARPLDQIRSDNEALNKGERRFV
jgi:hypothetical protein